MNNLSEKFTQKDLNILNEKLNIATCQINELIHITNKLDESDIGRLLNSFDGISRTASMLTSICAQLLNDDYIATSDPISYIHDKSDISFTFLDDLCVKHSLIQFSK